MLGWADVDWLRVLAYVVAAAACLIAARRDSSSAPGYWRPFFPLTAALLVCMAIGRAADTAEHVLDVVRDGAREDGWYAGRRRAQTVVVAALTAGWAVAVVGACLRMPERRRRYLPVVLATITLCCFVAVRVVSLHQIDTLLHHRHVAELRVGTLAEYALVAVLVVTTSATARSGPPALAGHSPEWEPSASP